MSMISGGFPNAITPTFSASADPVLQANARRDNENAVFAPVEEADSASSARSTTQDQPDRRSADQNQSSTNTSSDSEQGQQQSQDGEISQDELSLIRELSARDQEVRTHEQAHKAVGGQHAGAIEYTYQSGPDGKRYAVGGEVSIDVSAVPGDPSATMDKASQVRRAALAPAEPSAQDRSVAAMASQIYIDAQSDLRQMEVAETKQALEDRAEQQAIKAEEQQAAELSEEASLEEAKESSPVDREGLQEVLERTSEAVVAALEAAYRDIPLREIGSTLDASV